MHHTRRSILGTAGALLTGAAGASYVLADSHTAIEIKAFKEEEYVVLTNTGDESVNLSGYTVDFEHQQQQDQIYELPEGTILEPGDELVVATGALNVPDADLIAKEHEKHWLNNENPDAVALISPEGEVVASTSINTTTTTTEEEETTTEEEQEQTTTEEDEETTTTTEDEEEPSDGDGGDGGDGEGGGDSGEEQPTASVTFEDQETAGDSVVVQHTTLSDGGYIVIHDESGAVLGHSAYLNAGDHSNVEVTLDSPITSTQTLIAMAHTDDGDQTYEFPDADGPYTADGAPVTDAATVTVC